LKHFCFIILFFLAVNAGFAQTDIPNPVIEQQLENQAEAEDAETEDDSYQQQLQQYRKTPLNMNTAREADMQAFRWLTALQIRSFLQYRSLLGKLLNVYELQAVPYWTIDAINNTRPFISFSPAVSLGEDAGHRISEGTHTFMYRIGQTFEKSNGYKPKNDTTGPAYLGSPQRMFFRYKYQYKNLLQFGMVGDKDAGEQFGKGAQKYGFDFYSFHLFARDLGVVRRVAIGDFTVNFGQGLTTYQSLAFRKSVDVVNIKRQTEVLRPYNSPGEYNFHRGAAITVGSDKLQLTAFVSKKKVSANEVSSTDTLDTNEDFVSSIITSGLHRTASEVADRNSIDQFAFGGRLQYHGTKFQVAVNGVHYNLSKPLVKSPGPYNQYAFGGDQVSNLSIDYSYTFRNIHLFGEIASDDQASIAVVQGLIASLASRVDFSLFYRSIAKDYHSLYTTAFTETTTPINERGLYSGLSLRPWGFLRIDMYADMYSFPWLRYRVDRPSKGSDYVLQLSWKPNKQVDVYTRLKSEVKAMNYTSAGLAYHETEDIARQNWRTQVSYKVSPSISIRARTELVWYDPRGKTKETGFLMYADFFYKPMMSPVTFNTRLQYFETDGYNSRIYAYESDVLYSYSIPPFSGKGYRGYLNVNFDIGRHLTTWFRIARTVYPDQETIGSGNDLIEANHRTDYKVQLMYSF
jgi:hypothetical protein